uniref:Uncharacterized protein n=1 Tax=Vespula pensylvanica TaxID=30213 RepID=A0A834P5W2_VESPE|nr:hypothetical protein H0235_006007 [Vespula pensylvanica]
MAGKQELSRVRLFYALDQSPPFCTHIEKLHQLPPVKSPIPNLSRGTSCPHFVNPAEVFFLKPVDKRPQSVRRRGNAVSPVRAVQDRDYSYEGVEDDDDDNDDDDDGADRFRH